MLPFLFGVVAETANGSFGSMLRTWASTMNPLSLALSLVAALVSALIAAYITHRLSSKRAWIEWRRQRIFDSIVKLNENLELLVDRKHEIPLKEAWGDVEVRTVPDAVDVAYRADSGPLRELLYRYWNTLTEVNLLVGEASQLRTDSRAARCSANKYVNRLTKPFANGSKVEPMTLGDVSQGASTARMELRKAHDILVSGLASTYLSAFVKKPKVSESLTPPKN